jgi:hypothetical protein
VSGSNVSLYVLLSDIKAVFLYLCIMERRQTFSLAKLLATKKLAENNQCACLYEIAPVRCIERKYEFI